MAGRAVSGADEPSMIDCDGRPEGQTCEICGASLEPASGFLPPVCINLEAREDRAGEIARTAHFANMQKACAREPTNATGEDAGPRR